MKSAITVLKPGGGCDGVAMAANIGEFKRRLRERGETISSLARKTFCGRSHVSQVVNGRPGRGGHTRRKLAQFLTAEETALLGWSI